MLIAFSSLDPPSLAVSALTPSSESRLSWPRRLFFFFDLLPPNLRRSATLFPSHFPLLCTQSPTAHALHASHPDPTAANSTSRQRRFCPRRPVLIRPHLSFSSNSPLLSVFLSRSLSLSLSLTHTLYLSFSLTHSSRFLCHRHRHRHTHTDRQTHTHR